MVTTNETVTDRVRRGDPVLTDGAVETRVMFRGDVHMDPDVQVAAMVDDPAGRPVLHDVFAGDVAVAASRGVAIVVGTPTFRASARYAERAGLGDGAVERLNRDAVAFQRDVLRGTSDVDAWIAGVLGPAGDAYTPGDALDADGARAYHAEQARVLADAGVDFLFAATFPAVDEAAGIARAMRDTGVPCAVSFVLDHPVADPPAEWASAMWSLHETFGVPVLGGCCGTDDRHVDALARLMADEGRARLRSRDGS